MRLEFTKMHGLGNDFIVVDSRALSLPDEAGLARRLCERRFGIGADQFIVLHESGVADLGMRIINADGSVVEMCGNGVRCLAKYVWDRGISDKPVLEVETPAGIVKPERRGDLVRVDMGEPKLEARDIPVRLKGRVLDHPIEAAGETFKITCVSMGNPHAVVFTSNLAEFPVGRIGPVIETNPLFPNRTNVEFVEVMAERELRMRVWERGAGETLACGTGASAAAVAANVKGLTDKDVTVHLRGGELRIEWAEDNHVYMTGPAAEVFTGSVDV